MCPRTPVTLTMLLRLNPDDKRDNCLPMSFKAIACVIALLATASLQSHAGEPAKPWQLGTPIVTYWAGPAMTDPTAQQMTQAGWNLVWCRENELDVADRHGLRAQLQDALLAPASLENSEKRQQLDTLIERVRRHP